MWYYGEKGILVHYWEESKLAQSLWKNGINIAGWNINNIRYAYDTTLMEESEEELKSHLMKVKGEWKSWLKTQHSEN